MRGIHVNISYIMMIMERRSTLLSTSILTQRSTLKLDLRSEDGKRRGKGKEKEQDRSGV